MAARWGSMLSEAAPCFAALLHDLLSFWWLLLAPKLTLGSLCAGGVPGAGKTQMGWALGMLSCLSARPPAGVQVL